MTTHDTHDAPDPAATPGGPRLRLRLERPEDLLAALPHLLGFVPEDSVVLVALQERAGRTEVGAVVRADLVAPPDVEALVGACARRLGRRRPHEVVVAVVGGGAPDGGAAGDGAPDGGAPDDGDAGRGHGARPDPPRADVADAAAAMFEALRVPVLSRMWTPRVAAGAPWRCYPPCTCRGVLPDPGGSAAAAASAVLGHVTFGSRAALEELVRPAPGAGSPHRAALLAAARADGALDRELAGPAAGLRDRAAVLIAARELARGGVLGDAEIARVGAALLDPRVRDSCLGWSVGGAEDEGVPAAAAEQLWTLLTRELPPPEVAEPATLLACAALARGGGALVGAALARASEADPEHTLSRLVAALLERGVDREQMLEWIRAAAAESDAVLAGDGGVSRRRGRG